MGKMKTLLVIITTIVLVISIILTYLGGFFLQADRIIISGEAWPKVPLRNTPLKYLGVAEEISLSNDVNLALIDHAVYPGLGLALIDEQEGFIKWLPDAQLEYLGKGQLESAGEVLDWWRLEDFDKDNKKELAIQLGIAGTALVHPFYLYSYNGDEFKLVLKLIEASSQTKIIDLDQDGNYTIIHEYSLSGIGKLERDLLRFKDIWRLQDGKPVKANHLFPEEYKELVDLHTLALTKKSWEPDVSFYYPVLRCLKEKAGLTLQGKVVGIDECREILKEKYENSGQ